MEQLPILFEDQHYIAINKPSGVLVHKTPLEKDPEALFAVQMLEHQVGYKVYPLHRIDRPTTGVLLFGKSAKAASTIQAQFIDHSIKKYYLAILRGYLPKAHGMIDHPLAKDLEFVLQEAKTEYWTLKQCEIPFASTGRYPSSRYSLAKIYPHTGRMHQIRRHFAHLRHYIIGDTTHGDNRQNNFFSSQFQLENMLLHAWELTFFQPFSKESITIKADLPLHFLSIMREFNWPEKELSNHLV
ncbi:pseudouridine synthase [Cyclobacterium marinum]|uniref:tRNA pseudouridine synthase C n=1 Tax=Cyclobacterium marinum (strain ATCC 25205 / DSM 745 / LMG 13164 / NCIMB 1802) TaxID=880070 RepID=G0J895_CYCMS|nr:pseudouridine synthase [Cyclobacterium marinum]AEL27875.1 pseudouridine synthase [Cyclobacterium marinum DSM 745]MBR9777988.1 pseudouridylate synthase [Cytophagales bacterium]|tara:strand:+ start:184300 stop:185025 length:726 start_codon:yes stop_codon:yes gene_type:complete